MIIDIKDTLFLDDENQYIVISKISYENKIYYYLLDKNNSKNIKFCYEENNELIETDNKELIIKLLPLFVETAQKNINY